MYNNKKNWELWHRDFERDPLTAFLQHTMARKATAGRVLLAAQQWLPRHSTVTDWCRVLCNTPREGKMDGSAICTQGWSEPAEILNIGIVLGNFALLLVIKLLLLLILLCRNLLLLLCISIYRSKILIRFGFHKQQWCGHQDTHLIINIFELSLVKEGWFATVRRLGLVLQALLTRTDPLSTGADTVAQQISPIWIKCKHLLTSNCSLLWSLLHLRTFSCRDCKLEKSFVNTKWNLFLQPRVELKGFHFTFTRPHSEWRRSGHYPRYSYSIVLNTSVW